MGAHVTYAVPITSPQQYGPANGSMQPRETTALTYCMTIYCAYKLPVTCTIHTLTFLAISFAAPCSPYTHTCAPAKGQGLEAGTAGKTRGLPENAAGKSTLEMRDHCTLGRHWNRNMIPTGNLRNSTCTTVY